MYNENDLPMMAEGQLKGTMSEPQMNEVMPEPEMEQPKEWRPSHGEVLREFEINIRFLHRGCIVSVGCKKLAFGDHIAAMEAINAYVANPWEEQQKWRKILD